MLQSKADFFSTLDNDGAADESVLRARLRIDAMQTKLREKRLTSKQFSKRLTPSLRRDARFDPQRTLHPDLWIAHVRAVKKGGDGARGKVAEIIPKKPGRSKGYDKFAIGFTYMAAYRWLKTNRNERRNLGLKTPGISLHDAACYLTSEAMGQLANAGVPRAIAISSRQVRRFIESQPYLGKFCS